MQPIAYDDRYRYFISADIDTESAMAAALYMTLEYAGYTPLGLYSAR